MGVAPLAAAAISVGIAGVGSAVTTPPTPLSAVGGVVLASLVIAVGYVSAHEVGTELLPQHRIRLGVADGADFTAVVVGGVLTRWLAVEAGLGVVVASALVGLAAWLVVPERAAAAYCGSFVGMAAPAVLPGYVTVAAAGGVAGVVFILAAGVYSGFGGKLGATAFVGCTAVVLGTGAVPTSEPVPHVGTAVVLTTVAVVAAVLTYVLSVRFEYGPVAASAGVGLVAGGLAPVVFAEGTPVAAVAFCASFTGMVAESRLPGEPLVGVAGLATGAFFVATTPHFGGFGGKLGAIAFVGCLATYGLTVLSPWHDIATRRRRSL